MKKSLIKRFSSLLLVCLLACTLTLPVSAVNLAPADTIAVPTTASETVPTKPIPDTSADTDITKDLLDLATCLRNVYSLEGRVHTLEDYNTFRDGQGYLHMTDAAHPASIWSQLSAASQDAVRQLSTYQAFHYIMETPEYAQSQGLKQATDDYYEAFIEFMPPYVRESLWRFVPYVVTKELDPDQLCVLGRMVIDTEVYQALKAVLHPLVNFYSAEAIERNFAPAELVLLRYEISSAALKIWPDLKWEHASELPTTSTGN